MAADLLFKDVKVCHTAHMLLVLTCMGCMCAACMNDACVKHASMGLMLDLGRNAGFKTASEVSCCMFGIKLLTMLAFHANSTSLDSLQAMRVS